VIDWPLAEELARSFQAAHETQGRIATFVRHTPLLELRAHPAGEPPEPIAATGRTRRWLKLENRQHTGSFKIRGAASAITAGEPPREVLAASTGNHGLAVAAVARALKLPCRVFVPAAAATAKLALLREAGVELVEVDGDPLLAELAARETAERTPGALLVPPYNDPHVILGQATLGLELLEDLPQPPQALFVAVGGGGLISGITLAVRSRWPHCRIVGCLPSASPAMADAVAAGRVVPSKLEPTLADATAGNIEEGSITVAICAALVDEFELISEQEIAAAMRLALAADELEIEGAAALALAGSLRQDGTAESHVIVLGGGNVGAQTLSAIR
jgi:threonine dehydratase